MYSPIKDNKKITVIVTIIVTILEEEKDSISNINSNENNKEDSNSLFLDWHSFWLSKKFATS